MIHLSEKLNILVTPKSRDKFKEIKTFDELGPGDILYDWSTDGKKIKELPIIKPSESVKFPSKWFSLPDSENEYDLLDNCKVWVGANPTLCPVEQTTCWVVAGADEHIWRIKSTSKQELEYVLKKYGK